MTLDMIETSWWLGIAVAASIVGSVFATLRLALLDLSFIRYSELNRAELSRKAEEARSVDANATAVLSESPEDDPILDDPNGHAMAVALPALLMRMVVTISMVCWSGSLRHESFLIDPMDLLIGLGLGGVLVWVSAIMLAQSIAEHAGERVVHALYYLVRITFFLTFPLRIPVAFVDEVIRRLTGAERLDESQELEAELREVVEEGERGGQIDEVEREMIEAVVEFRTTDVDRIMTPRTEMMALAYTDDLAEVKAGVRSIGHSRIPVYREDLDHVAGLLYARDLLAYLADTDTDDDDEFSLETLLRPAIFVPESKSVRELLRELLGKQVHMAMVADEYGGTSGLVTIEDIVEEVFGEIQDEYEEAVDEEASIRLDPASRSAIIEARVYIDDANDRLEDISLELPEHEDYDTVGGYVVVGLGRIPLTGETWRQNNLLVTVLDAEPTRVVRIRIEPAPADEDSAAD